LTWAAARHQTRCFSPARLAGDRDRFRACRDPRARDKASAARLSVDFRVADVTGWSSWNSLTTWPSIIGCLHSLGPRQQEAYAARSPG